MKAPAVYDSEKRSIKWKPDWLSCGIVFRGTDHSIIIINLPAVRPGERNSEWDIGVNLPWMLI